MDAVALVQDAVWASTPVAFAATGETIAERSGMLNIGLEGMMLTGAFVGVITTSATHLLWLGFVAGIGIGAAIGLLHALLTLWAGLDQVVSGLMLNLLAQGGTTVLDQIAFPGSNSGTVATMPNVPIPLLSKLPYVGQILFQQRLATYLLLPVGIATFVILTRTTTGLRIHAAGEDVDAATLEGVLVRPLRLATNTVAGAFSGAGGAFLALGIAGGFGDNMTAGRGYIALAMVIIGRWNCLLVIPAALLFGLASSVGIQLQVSSTHVPYQFFIALPYIVTVLVMFGRVASKRAPRQLGQAWEVEDVGGRR